ncbi:MAG: hypothetical protein ABW022_14790 [Actinoplanes sp.]
MTTAMPTKVRYAELDSPAEWVFCADAHYNDNALVIRFSERDVDIIPFHAIRGRIEIRDNREVSE